MVDLTNYYTGENHTDENGTYAVIDAAKLYADRELFSGEMKTAQRREPVYVWNPRAGEVIAETGRPPVAAAGNELVFVKKLVGADGNTNLKIYIPSDDAGQLAESILDEKYEAAVMYHPKDAETDMVLQALPHGAQVRCRMPKQLPILILQEAIDRPSIILDARGVGKHQTMKPGDSLKFEDGSCLPLPKSELDSSAWQVSPANNKYRT